MSNSNRSLFPRLRPSVALRTMSGPRPVVLSGPSGAGKSTLLKRLMKEHEGVFGFSVSRTFLCQLMFGFLAKRPVWGGSSSLILHLPVTAVKLTLMFLQFFPRRHNEKPSTRRRRWQRYNTYEWNPACCWHFLSGCSCLVLSHCVRINHKTSALHLDLSLQGWDKSG